MNEPSKAWGEQWLDAQQAMWKAAFPGMPTPASGAQPAHEATSLAEQFNELRDTWQASVAKWTDFAREATEGELPSADQCRQSRSPRRRQEPSGRFIRCEAQPTEGRA